ncbi:MAG TPA: hypothetical protein VGW32_00770 [Pyrinomonadaceae bacterium]|nr:hypothetical protein [Pyrinomonadaceae bacterium]
MRSFPLRHNDDGIHVRGGADIEPCCGVARQCWLGVARCAQ